MKYIAFDQYHCAYTIQRYPRKELLQNLCATHADKIYVDTLEGKTRHVGYVIDGLWLTVFKAEPFKEVNE